MGSGIFPFIVTIDAGLEAVLPLLCKFTMTQRKHLVKYCRLKKTWKIPLSFWWQIFYLFPQVQPGIYSLSQRANHLKMFCVKNDALVRTGTASPQLFPSSQRVAAGPGPAGPEELVGNTGPQAPLQGADTVSAFAFQEDLGFPCTQKMEQCKPTSLKVVHWPFPFCWKGIVNG